MLLFPLMALLGCAPEEQAVIIEIPLSDQGFGSAEEQAAITALGDSIEQAIIQAGIGEYDGHEFGAGLGVLYMYGSDAEYLFRTLQPQLAVSPVCKGAKVIVRAGPPGAKQREVTL